MNRLLNVRVLNWSNRFPFKFSLMKKNLSKLSGPSNLTQLHDRMVKFQKSLDQKQLGKYKRISNKFGQRIRKMLIKQTNNSTSIDKNLLDQKIINPIDVCNNFPKIQLERTTIYGLLYRTQLQILKQCNQIGVTIQIPEINTFFNRFMQYDLQNYCFMVSQAQLGIELNIYHLIIQKFNILEQEFSKKVFKDYNIFKSSVANKLFKKEKVYKGQYTFQIDQSRINENSLSNIISILKSIAQFGLLSDKYLLGLELIIKSQWTNLKTSQIADLLKILAISGRSIPKINDNILQIYKVIQKQNGIISHEQALHNNQAILYYVLTSKLQNYYIIQELTEEIQILQQKVQKIYKKFTINWYISSICVEILRLKYDKKIMKPQIQPASKKHQQKQKLLMSQLTKDITDYLDRNSFNFSLQKCKIINLPKFNFPIANTSQQHPITLFPLPPLFYNLTSISEQNPIPIYTPNGLYYLLNQFFVLQKQSEFKKNILKSINISKKQWMNTRTQFDDYLESKTKGIQRGPRKKRKIFNF